LNLWEDELEIILKTQILLIIKQYQLCYIYNNRIINKMNKILIIRKIILKNNLNTYQNNNKYKNNDN
jgi:hypothetical protein